MLAMSTSNLLNIYKKLYVGFVTFPGRYILEVHAIIHNSEGPANVQTAMSTATALTMSNTMDSDVVTGGETSFYPPEIINDTGKSQLLSTWDNKLYGKLIINIHRRKKKWLSHKYYPLTIKNMDKSQLQFICDN